jgi:general secretion pathway protein C
VDWLLRRNFWMVRLVGLMVVTALAANTTTTLLTFYLLSSTASAEPLAPDDDPEDEGEEEATLAASAPARTDERARRAERTAERILGHNPFCPTCSPSTPTPTPDAMPLEPGRPELAGARRSELPLAVAATMEADDPAHSLATLVDTTRGSGGLFGVGDRLGPQIEIVHVATGVVHIRNAGRLEYIPFDALPLAPKATAEPKPADEGKPPSDSSRSIPGASDAIQCSGEGDCVVERSFVEKLMAEPKLLMGQGGATPATTKDGAPGFRLRGVKKGTLPDLLGLKNGDVITEVGGSPLTMDVLPGLYGKLRHASHIEVTVDRRGERMTRSLEIRS